ncbi:MAG: hypothetical protein GY913_14265, partial [Proteobacteria bacterium]|nr:hypothetical protein [Pseudomonadota bacterium]
AQSFDIEVPLALGTLQLLAVHDLDQDGPGLDDPGTLVEIEVGDTDLSATLELLGGGLEAAIDALEPPFDEGVVIAGELVGELDRPLIIDLRDPDDALLGLWQLAGLGPFELIVPPDLGEVTLAAYLDRDLDGEGVDDAFGEAELTIGTDGLSDLELELVEGTLVSGEGVPDIPVPFESYEGDTVTLRGEVRSDQDLPIDLDLRGVQPETGKLGALGKLPMAAPGSFELDVPADLGELQLQAFQDLTHDGPSDDDPFGWVTLDVAGEDLVDLEIVLEEGGKLKHAAELGPTDATVPFFDYEGETVVVSGTVASDAEGSVNLDVRVPDADAPGGNRQVGKLILPPGTGFTFDAPVDVGPLLLEAFQDLQSDGPDDADPWGNLEIEVGSSNLTDLLIELVAGAKGAAAAGSEGQPASTGFTGHEGGWVNLQVLVTSDQDGSVDLDLRAPDASAPGGNVQVGKQFLDGPGAKAIRAPADFGTLWIEGFQDLDRDGPSPTDPYAKIELDVGDGDATITLALEVGGFRADGQPDQPSPDHTPDEGGSPTVPRGGGTDIFGAIEGASVLLMGTITVEDAAEGVLVDIDVFTRDPDAPGGRKYLGKLKVEPGPWTLKAPADYGLLELEALVDTDGD